MIQVTFTDRSMTASSNTIGVEDDNRIEVVHFDVPEIFPAQTAYVFFENSETTGKYMLGSDGLWPINRGITSVVGLLKVRIRVVSPLDEAWNSLELKFKVLNVFDVDSDAPPFDDPDFMESAFATMSGYASRAEAAADSAESTRDDFYAARDEALGARDAAAESATSAWAAATKAEMAESGAKTSQEAAEAAQRDARAKVDSLVGMTAEAVTLAPGSLATASVELDGGVLNLTLGLPEGKKGDKGDKGDRGEQGIQGVVGERGPQGIQGPVGDTGPVGAQGAQGDKGDKGDKGDTGAQGIQGIQGPKGDTGAKGDKGDKGDTGSGFIVHGYYTTAVALASNVTNPSDGDAYGVGSGEPFDIYIWDGVNRTWVNNGPLQGAKGEKGDKGDKGDTGSQGIQGIQGPQGPQGSTGAQGAPGNIGATGAQGPKGDTGAQGIQGIQGIKGDTGEPGAKGEKGDKGDAGTPGAKGDKGDKGDTGAQGPKGNDGAVGATGPQGPKGDSYDPADVARIGALESAVQTKADKPKQYAVSVPVSSWTGSAAPYTATLTVTGVPANAIGSAGLSDAATDVQYEAALAAQIRVAGSSANTVILKAHGDKPTIALPIIVEVRGVTS